MGSRRLKICFGCRGGGLEYFLIFCPEFNGDGSWGDRSEQMSREVLARYRDSPLYGRIEREKMAGTEVGYSKTAVCGASVRRWSHRRTIFYVGLAVLAPQR